MKLITICFFLIPIQLLAQSATKTLVKIEHAEPMFNDLVRDLGGLKGEKEINIAGEFINNKQQNEYGLLVEYEFVPINRLGIEIEADFLFMGSAKNNAFRKKNKLDVVHVAAQYSFLVLKNIKTTFAIGYKQALAFNEFEQYKKQNSINGFVFNPFFIAAKKWRNNFHSIVYLSPQWKLNQSRQTTFLFQINTAVHYSIPTTKSIIGLELNMNISNHTIEPIIRPQLKIKITKKLAAGLLVGVPLIKIKNNYSIFTRLIYEL